MLLERLKIGCVFTPWGGLFLGNHGNIIGKHQVFVLSVSSANTSENLGSKTLKMKRKVFVVVDHLHFVITVINLRGEEGGGGDYNFVVKHIEHMNYARYQKLFIIVY